MQHSLVIFGLLFPSGQNPAKAIHPAMSPLNAPERGFEVPVFTGVRLLFTGLNMWLVTATLQIRFQPSSFVTFVQTEPEFPPRMPRLKGIERIRNQFDVVRVRCCDDQRQRKPPGVRQQAALYTLFPFVLRIATCFLFLTAAIWSYNRPSTTRTSQCCPDARRQANRSARSAQKCLNRATP